VYSTPDIFRTVIHKLNLILFARSDTKDHIFQMIVGFNTFGSMVDRKLETKNTWLLNSVTLSPIQYIKRLKACYRDEKKCSDFPASFYVS
jgi:hypothetical protein